VVRGRQTVCTAYDVAVFIAEELLTTGDDGEQPPTAAGTLQRDLVGRFCRLLAARLDDADLRGDLYAWANRYAPDRAAPRPTTAAPAHRRASVIAQIAPSAAGRGSYLLTIWRLVGDQPGVQEYCGRLSAAEVRRAVEIELPRVIAGIPAGLESPADSPRPTPANEQAGQPHRFPRDVMALRSRAGGVACRKT
jgi:hypothetical protein